MLLFSILTIFTLHAQETKHKPASESYGNNLNDQKSTTLESSLIRRPIIQKKTKSYDQNSDKNSMPRMKMPYKFAKSNENRVKSENDIDFELGEYMRKCGYFYPPQKANIRVLIKEMPKITKTHPKRNSGLSVIKVVAKKPYQKKGRYVSTNEVNENEELVLVDQSGNVYEIFGQADNGKKVQIGQRFI